jgi:hypothetical protein
MIQQRPFTFLIDTCALKRHDATKAFYNFKRHMCIEEACALKRHDTCALKRHDTTKAFYNFKRRAMKYYPHPSLHNT